MNLRNPSFKSVELILRRVRSLGYRSFYLKRKFTTIGRPFNMSTGSSSAVNTPLTPRPSASLVIVNGRNEILLVQRNPKARFFAGVHVSMLRMTYGSPLTYNRSFPEETLMRSKMHLSPLPRSEKLLRKQDFWLRPPHLEVLILCWMTISWMKGGMRFTLKRFASRHF